MGIFHLGNRRGGAPWIVCFWRLARRSVWRAGFCQSRDGWEGVLSQIEIQDLRYRYPDGTEALKRLNAHVVEGECVGIVGPNGAGKITLLLVLAGFLKPTGSSVQVEGLSLDGQNVRQIRQWTGFYFITPTTSFSCPRCEKT